MERKRILQWVFLVAVVLVLVGAVGLTLAQGPGTDDVLPQGEVEVAASLDDVIPIQGRLLDANGNPINGTRHITMTLYDAPTEGTALCSDDDDVAAVNGLFNAYMDYCTAEDLNGRQVWLGIKVGGDAEMTPRTAIYAVPYAWSLRPRAVISETSASAILNVFNHGNGWGLDAYSKGHDAVHGRSDASNHAGVSGENTGGGIGVYGHSTGSGLSGPAIKAFAGGSSGIALHADATSTDSSVVIHNRGSGPLLKGFGADGGEDEIRINNNGSIETKADSYIFVPGAAATALAVGTADVDLHCLTGGFVEVNNLTMGEKTIQFSVSLPAVLYGQSVKVEEVTVFFMTPPAGTCYISKTRVLRQKADSCCLPDVLVQDLTARGSSTWTSYSVTPTANNVLSATQGFLTVELTLTFNAPTHPITIGGVRVRLGHHHLY